MPTNGGINWYLSPVSIWRPSFPGMGIPVLKIRRSRDRLIFNMGIPILVRRQLYIETAPWSLPGPWLNIKMPSYQYRKSHCGDKTAVRSSYFHNGISYTGKMTSLYWIRALEVRTQFILNLVRYISELLNFHFHKWSNDETNCSWISLG